MEVQTIGDLPKVAEAAQRERAELDACIAELTAAEEQRRELMEALEANARGRPNLQASVEALLAGTLSGGTDPYQLLIAEKALHIQRLRQEAAACAALDVATMSDLVQLTAVVGRVVGLLQLAEEAKSFHREASVEETRRRVVARVQTVCQQGLTKLCWATEVFVKPLDWQEVSTCLDWLLTLEGGNARAALQPFFEPLRKKFVFHFLDTPQTSRPDLFGQCCKWALGVLELRSDFLISKVQHNSMTELVRDLSVLLTIRAKRDFASLLRESPVSAQNNKVFLDSVDELFSWSEIVEQFYGYALLDATLEHALLAALLPGDAVSPVASHWLQLERAAVEQQRGTGSVLPELFVRARRRLAVLPATWQRRAYFAQVHAPILRQMAAELSAGGDGRLEELFALGSTLTDWSMRPEFDQDDDLLAALATECLERVKRTLAERANDTADTFLRALTSWLTKNWLYVSETATAVLLAGRAHLDLSPELCRPYEQLRDNLRLAERRLGPLFARFALLLAERIDQGLADQLVFEFAPAMSAELARQLAFDLSLLFGLWADVVAEQPARLFKRLGDCLAILQMGDNELTAVGAVHRMEEQHQRSFLSQRFKLDNLSVAAVRACAELRKDRD